MWVFGRAPHGGVSEFDRTFKGGEFLPFYVPRPVMPQVNETDYPALFAFLGYVPEKRFFMPCELHPHQRIDMIKAELMPPEVLAKPVLISNDRYVLDGNHRWLAHSLNKTLVPCLVVDQPFVQAIDTLFKFPLTFELKFHQETN